MDEKNPFFRQVDLLVRLLPIVAEQPCFALKGGTAINLFVRDLPRLSVDIDLAYLPIEDRQTSLAEIEKALLAIKADAERRLGANIQLVKLAGEERCYKLNIALNRAVVKIEVTPVLRGSVFDAEMKTVTEQVEQQFGFAEMQLLSFEDLYAGKICAALDRQHPRDLFDIKLLLENEGVSDKLKTALLVYLIAHNRPMAELLSPNLVDFRESYQAEFQGMVLGEVTLPELERIRGEFIALIRRLLTDEDKEFLLSVKRREPQWEYLGLRHIQELPGVQWKMHNLMQMDSARHKQAIEKLESVLFG